jgi:transcriptional regulator with XRE-family HTH domain
VNIALVRRDLLDSLNADPEYRHAWNLENVYTSVCFQLRALREQREWSQAALGKEAGMAPERISILEDPNSHTKPTLNTLLRIANACDVGLEVRFVPYSVVIDRSTRTSLKELEVPSFNQELPELEKSIAAEIAKQRYLNEPVERKQQAGVLVFQRKTQRSLENIQPNPENNLSVMAKRPPQSLVEQPLALCGFAG